MFGNPMANGDVIEVSDDYPVLYIAEALEALLAAMVHSARTHDGKRPEFVPQDLKLLADAVINAAGQAMWGQKTIYLGALPLVAPSGMDAEVRMILGLKSS